MRALGAERRGSGPACRPPPARRASRARRRWSEEGSMIRAGPSMLWSPASCRAVDRASSPSDAWLRRPLPRLLAKMRLRSGMRHRLDDQRVDDDLAAFVDIAEALRCSVLEGRPHRPRPAEFDLERRVAARHAAAARGVRSSMLLGLDALLDQRARRCRLQRAQTPSKNPRSAASATLASRIAFTSARPMP